MLAAWGKTDYCCSLQRRFPIDDNLLRCEDIRDRRDNVKQIQIFRLQNYKECLQNLI